MKDIPSDRFGGDYDALIESMGLEVVLKVDDDDYQGDSRVLLRDGHRFGFLMFGWGSCSGCDALQACDSMAEVIELRQQMFDSIVWHESPYEMADFLEGRDWATQIGGNSKETKDFVARAVEMLRGMTVKFGDTKEDCGRCH